MNHYRKRPLKSYYPEFVQSNSNVFDIMESASQKELLLNQIYNFPHKLGIYCTYNYVNFEIKGKSENFYKTRYYYAYGDIEISADIFTKSII